MNSVRQVAVAEMTEDLSALVNLKSVDDSSSSNAHVTVQQSVTSISLHHENLPQIIVTPQQTVDEMPDKEVAVAEIQEGLGVPKEMPEMINEATYKESEATSSSFNGKELYEALNEVKIAFNCLKSSILGHKTLLSINKFQLKMEGKSLKLMAFSALKL